MAIIVKPEPQVMEAPPSTSYVVVDADGRVLVEVAAMEEATRLARRTPGAIAILGAPHGTIFARVATGSITVPSEATVRRAARRWLKRAAKAAA